MKTDPSTESIQNSIAAENRTAAEEAGLRYVQDKEPGFTRRRKGKGFLYLDPQKNKVSSENILHRIQSLVIPPAWEDVWICRFGNGHLQATGRDVRERKQYRYHNEWSQVRNQTKFDKLLRFGELLPDIRAQVQKISNARIFSKEKVLAAVIELMEATRIRIGNDIYAEENDSYGLTTLHNKHVKVQGSAIQFRFKGKSGVQHDVGLQDPRLSRIIRHCQELPGQELFAYEDSEGNAHDIGSADVNNYLKEISGEQITAKDFRTWSATVKALEMLASEIEIPCTKKYLKAREVSVIKETASHLGNTVAVCRKYYVHPVLFKLDAQGELAKIRRAVRKSRSGLTKEESVLMKLLKDVSE